MTQKEKDLFLKDVADIYIFGFVTKLSRYYPEGYPEIEFLEIFDDNMMGRQRRHGIYGWCEVGKSPDEKEYGNSTDWPIKSCPLKGHEIVKFSGVVEYRLKEILAGREEFKLTQNDVKALAVKLFPEMTEEDLSYLNAGGLIPKKGVIPR